METCTDPQCAKEIMQGIDAADEENLDEADQCLASKERVKDAEERARDMQAAQCRAYWSAGYICVPYCMVCVFPVLVLGLASSRG